MELYSHSILPTTTKMRVLPFFALAAPLVSAIQLTAPAGGTQLTKGQTVTIT